VRSILHRSLIVMHLQSHPYNSLKLSNCFQCSSKTMELWINLPIAILLQFMLRCHTSTGASVCSCKSLRITHDSLNPFTKSLAGCAKKFLSSGHQKLNYMELVKTKSNQSTKNTSNNRRLFSTSGNS
jgi:hypothetical protein